MTLRRRYDLVLKATIQKGSDFERFQNIQVVSFLSRCASMLVGHCMMRMVWHVWHGAVGCSVAWYGVLCNKNNAR